MGISLFGLTPAATYPSLIKFGDNSAISGTLRALSDGLGTDLPIQVSTAGVNFTGTASIGGTAIVTNASGVSGAIQFSNGSAFASDATNFFWDDTNNRLGVGTNAPTAPVNIKGPTNTGTILVSLENSTRKIIDITDRGAITANAYNSANNIYSLGYGGAFDAGALTLFGEANANGVFLAGKSDLNNYIIPNLGLGIAVPTAKAHIKGSGSTSATTSLLVQNSAGTQLLKVTDDNVLITGNVNIGTAGGESIRDFSGAQAFSFFYTNTQVRNQLSFGGGYLGPFIPVGGTTSSFPGLKRNGTAIDLRLADDSNYAGLNAGATTIKGSGSTSATTSLLVQNSAGLSALTITDDRNATFGSGVTTGGNIISGANVQAVSTGYFILQNRLLISSPSVGILKLGNNNDNDFDRLQFGGTTSSFPSIKRNGTAIDFRLADDSAACNISANNITALAGIAAYSTIEGYSSSQAGSFTGAVRVGSGGSNSASAILDVVSTTKGFLPPRMTTTQRDAIVTPATGLKIYNTTLGTTDTYDGATWQRFGQQTLIKGSGSTSATTSLLVQNSAGSNLLRIRDDGNIFCEGGGAFSSVGIIGTAYGLFGGASYIASASLVCGGTTQGFLPPRMTTTQRDAIVTPATGLRIYNTTTNTNDTYNGTAWQSNSVSGVSGAIQFSNGSAFASDAANFFWNNTTKRLGIGTNTPTTSLDVNGSIRAGVNLTVVGEIQNPTVGVVNINGELRVASPNVSIGLTSYPARLAVKGSGSTSATTSLLVQNSGGTELLKVSDNGDLTTTDIIARSIYAKTSTLDLRGNSSGSASSASLQGFVSGLGWLSMFTAESGKDFGQIPRGAVVNGTTIDASAIFQADSTTKGFLPPRMTTTQRTAITGTAGLMVYDTTVNKLFVHNGVGWEQIQSI